VTGEGKEKKRKEEGGGESARHFTGDCSPVSCRGLFGPVKRKGRERKEKG